MNNRYRRTLLSAAVLGAVASAGAQAATPDFYGYFRTGVGTSNEGGEQVCFRLPGAGGAGGWRLGNECGTYGEIGLGADLFNKEGIKFRYNLMLDYWAGVNAGDEQNISDTSSNDRRIGLRQNYVAVTGWVGGKDATVWLGKRYYQRHDVHAMDFFYWNNSGPGFGIENVDVGVGKFHAALIRTTANTGSANVSDETRTGNSLDFRLSNLKLNPGGELEVGVDFRSADERDSVAPQSKSGQLLTVEHTQSNLWGGFNKLALQKGTDAAATNAFNFTAADVDLTRLVEHLVIAPTQQFSMMAALVWEKTETSAGDQTWTSIGARPMYHWSRHLTSGLELSRDTVEYADGTEGRLTKLTVVPLMIRTDAGPWARPELRLFVTRAEWNDAANAHSTGGQLVSGADFAGAKDGTTIGVQVEAWW